MGKLETNVLILFPFKFCQSKNVFFFLLDEFRLRFEKKCNKKYHVEILCQPTLP